MGRPKYSTGTVIKEYLPYGQGCWLMWANERAEDRYLTLFVGATQEKEPLRNEPVKYSKLHISSNFEDWKMRRSRRQDSYKRNPFPGRAKE